jgi:hypothetical protein
MFHACVVILGTTRSSALPIEVTYESNRILLYVVYWSKFLPTDPEDRVRFPPQLDFLRSSGSGKWSGSILPNPLKQNIGFGLELLP